MPDDDFIDLIRAPENLESRSGESDEKTGRRSSFSAFVVLLVFGIPLGYLFWTLQDRPGGIQIATMVAYTFAIPYILSDRFLNPVPWALLNLFRERFLLVHCLALAVLYGIVTGAYAIKPRLPAWFVISGRKGSFFDLCLLIAFLILSFCECSWISRHKSEQAASSS